MDEAKVQTLISQCAKVEGSGLDDYCGYEADHGAGLCRNDIVKKLEVHVSIMAPWYEKPPQPFALCCSMHHGMLSQGVTTGQSSSGEICRERHLVR